LQKGYLDTKCKQDKRDPRLSFIVNKRIGKPSKEWNFEVIKSIDFKRSVCSSLTIWEALTVMIGMPAQKADQEQVADEDEPRKESAPAEDEMDDLRMISISTEGIKLVL
jgi:hypothetical protein